MAPSRKCSIRSAKAKAVRLQNKTCDKLIDAFPDLAGHVQCAIMGETGADLKLNTNGQAIVRLFQWECEPAQRSR